MKELMKQKEKEKILTSQEAKSTNAAKKIANMKLIYGPDPIFKKKALEVEKVDADILATVDMMSKIMDKNDEEGISANMVGLLKRIIVVQDL